MPSVVILTSDELRHRFARKALGLHPKIEVLRSYCEAPEQSLGARVARKGDDADPIEKYHVVARDRSEEDFFAPFVRLTPDRSNPVQVPRGWINQPDALAEMKELAPDLLVAYGCSIVKDHVLAEFDGRVVNVHLGLSPYYRGSGTNFWALV